MIRWCVRHRDGWCRVKGGRRPKDSADNVATHCGFVVTLPWGFERRTPTCLDCNGDPDHNLPTAARHE